MIVFTILVVLLVITLTFFIAFPIITTRMSNETYKSLCDEKIRRIAKRNNLLQITNLNISKFDSERIYVDQIVFGKKYIYLISDVKLKGFVVGDENDKSWIHYNYFKKHAKYVANLNELAKENIDEFAGILGINKEPFISICLIPNNCDFKITGENKQSNRIVHFSSLNRKIRRFEKGKINSLDEEQIYEQYKIIEEANEQNKIR